MESERWAQLPPPPSKVPAGSKGVPAPIRRVAAVVAVIAFVDGLLMWLLSFVPGSPTAGFWPVLVMPAFAAIFPVWGVTVFDTVMRNRDRSTLRSGMPIPLRGWRKRAGVVVFIVPWFTFMAVFFSGALAGQAEQDGDRYYANNHGEITELTREEWEQSRALESRLFAGGVMAFAGLAALYLTQPPSDDEEPEFTPPPRSDHPVSQWIGQLAGVTTVSATAQGDPDAVMARLRQVVPVRELARSPGGAISVHANWDQKGRWPVPSFPLRLDGEVRSVGASAATLDLTIQPAGANTRYMPIGGALGGAVMAGIGVFILTRPGLPAIGMVFIPIWIGWALFIAYTNVTAGRRVARKAASQM